MSNFSDFRDSNILRNPTTWIVAVMGFAYGGYNMLVIRELRRAEVHLLRTPWLATERIMDITWGGLFQVLLLMCAVWVIAGLCENANVWIRQSLVVLLYLGLNLIGPFL